MPALLTRMVGAPSAPAMRADGAVGVGLPRRDRRARRARGPRRRATARTAPRSPAMSMAPTSAPACGQRRARTRGRGGRGPRSRSPPGPTGRTCRRASDRASRYYSISLGLELTRIRRLGAARQTSGTGQSHGRRHGQSQPKRRGAQAAHVHELNEALYTPRSRNERKAARPCRPCSMCEHEPA